ncbi:hypothetical protein EK21DRAFT_102237 [Setomelanomma holmii]|uniref:Poly(A) RNA polymerase mitochondrial-like central palm domain-containing protein n=1 Tax=Setomelanomma holmii TaxID=210430 RepID=A0A9P4H4H3_9PLEO|nr:hypothetical protein EK21DRAFT_102237 [Setomelanomma holmii]
MKPSHTRLICRAPNRFTPSIALWQHFIGPQQHIPSQPRFSSTVSEAVQDSTSSDNTVPGPGDSGPLQEEAETRNVLTQNKPSNNAKSVIRKTTTVKGIWHPDKRDASISKNIDTKHAARQASVEAAEQLLTAAKTAFDEGKDYKGVVVQPMLNATTVKESKLPWCLAPEERTILGIDRLAIEIEIFYTYSKPSYYESLARRHVIEQVRKHSRQTLPDHILEVFGSERTGLAMAMSDIDLRLLPQSRIEDPEKVKLPPTHEQRMEGMKNLHKLHFNNLARQKAYLLPWLRYARYPLISLQDKQSGLDIQIVLSNDTSLSRETMKRYMDEYPYLHQLYFVVKAMFDIRGLSDVFRGGFGSYSLFMMIVASIKHLPNKRNDAAGALLHFLKFYKNLDTVKNGVCIEPAVLFKKSEEAVMPDKVKSRLEATVLTLLQGGAAKPLPKYMLSLRDPADKTNDLGRKGIAIKHVQATFKILLADLESNIKSNSRPSLLGPLVGSSYMLNKERRDRLRHYGQKLSSQLKDSLAKTAKMVKEREQAAEEAKLAEEANKESEEDKKKARLVREERDREFTHLAEERNVRLRREAERTAVLDHGDAMASILGMPIADRDPEGQQKHALAEESEAKMEAQAQSGAQSSPEKKNP